MAHKYVIAIAFLAVAAVAINEIPPRSELYGSDNKSHHLVVGYRVPGDKLILRENIIKNSAWFRVQTVEKTFSVPPYQTITQVQALDQKTNGKGAFASLLHGGPGSRNVTMKFKSQRGHGINFVVEIYAR